MKLFIGTGVEGIRPEGYMTVDINPNTGADIIANAADLGQISSGSADEFYASHVLEHFPWPNALQVLAEWARILRIGGVIKIAVPDMSLFGSMLARNENPWLVMTSIFGAHWATPGGAQGHYFGYTPQMLIDALTVLGFADFEHWNSDYPEAANGWLYGDNAEQLALSLNIRATKKSQPMANIPDLYEACSRRICEPFRNIARDIASAVDFIEFSDAHYAQRLHFQLIVETNRRKELERQLMEMRQ